MADLSFEDRLQRVSGLVDTVEAAPDSELKAAALELVQSVLDLHGRGLERVIEIAQGSGSAGFEIMDRFGKDELTGGLLALYDLHPVDLQTRVKGAIESVRPTLSLHEGDVELLKIENGVVQLRLRGNCNGCPSSAETLRQTIEEAILTAAPDVSRIEVEGAAESAAPEGLVQIARYSTCEFTAA